VILVVENVTGNSMEKKLLIKYIDVDICQQEESVLQTVNLEIHAGEFVY
jgi:cell division transport system ATP-binding protein